MKFLTLFLVCLLPTSAIAGEHDSVESRRSRPEAEAELDCGGRAGNLTVRHAGRGLFAASTYELRAEFGDGDDLRIQTNLGWNLDLRLRLTPLSIHWFGKDIDCTSPQHAEKCASLVKRVQSKMQAVWQRKQDLTGRENEALLCLRGKLARYATKIDRYAPAYYSPPRSSSSDRNGTGGLGFTLDGKVGLKIAPHVVVPMSGGGPKLGF